MKKTFCDRCGTELRDHNNKVTIEKTDLYGDTREDLTEKMTPVGELDLCGECAEALAEAVLQFCRKEGKAKKRVATSQPEQEEKAKRPRMVDAGKIRALHAAGWTVKDIAGEMSCSEVTVYKALNKKKDSSAPDSKARTAEEIQPTT